jgi:hypothetical protein
MTGRIRLRLSGGRRWRYRLSSDGAGRTGDEEDRGGASYQCAKVSTVFHPNIPSLQALLHSARLRQFDN